MNDIYETFLGIPGASEQFKRFIPDPRPKSKPKIFRCYLCPEKLDSSVALHGESAQGKIKYICDKCFVKYNGDIIFTRDED